MTDGSRARRLKNALESLYAPVGHPGLQRVVGRTNLLVEGLRELVRDPDIPVTYAMSRGCKNLLAGALPAFQSYYLGRYGQGVDVDRLHRNAWLLAATAEAAVAARGVVSEQLTVFDLLASCDLACHGRSGDLLPEDAVEYPDDVFDPSCSIVELVTSAYAFVSGNGISAGEATYWTLWWLEMLPDPAHSLCVPVAGYFDGSGFMAHLMLSSISDTEDPILFEHPESALRPLGRDLLHAMLEAWDLSPCSACWALTLASAKPALQSAHFDGRSLSGAAACGFRLLMSGQLQDVSRMVVAEAILDGTLRSVAHETEKLQAAVEQGIQEVIIAFNPNPPTLRERQLQQASGLSITRCPTVSHALPILSGVAEDLRTYLEKVLEAPDASGVLASLSGAPPLSSVYVEPDVMEDSRNQGQRRPSAQTYGTPWSDVWKGARTARNWRTMLCAPSGHGKTTVALMTARALAKEALQGLAAHHLSPHEVPMPVFVDMAVLEEVVNRVAGASPVLLDDAVRALLEEQGASPSSARFIADNLNSYRCWLFLDNAESLSSSRIAGGISEALKTWESHIVFLYRRDGRPSSSSRSGAEVFVLQSLNSKQQEELVRNYGGITQNVRRILTDSRRLSQMMQEPLLLSALCRVSQRHAIPSRPTPTWLYRQTLLDLLGQTPTGSVDSLRAEELFPFLAEVVFTLSVMFVGRPSFNMKELRQVITESGSRPWPRGRSETETAALTPAERAGLVLQELIDKHVLVPTTPQREAFRLPHSSFVDFLVAGHLAEIARTEPKNAEQSHERASEEKSDFSVRGLVADSALLKEWWPSIRFLAGLMKKPTALLRLLTHAQRVEPFRHRLLAATCLPELADSGSCEIRETVDELATLVFDHIESGRRYAYLDQLKPRALMALAEWNPKLHGECLADYVLKRVKSFDARYFRMLRWMPGLALHSVELPVFLMSQLAPQNALAVESLAPPKVVNTIAGFAASALKAMGRAVSCNPALIAVLRDTLYGSNLAEQRRAIVALHLLGEPIGDHSELVDQLVVFVLTKPAEELGVLAARALGPMASQIEQGSAIRDLVSAANGSSLQGRLSLAVALAAIAHEGCLDDDATASLSKALHGDEESTAAYAALAFAELARIGHADDAVIQALRHGLVRFRQDFSREGVREAISNAILPMTPTILTHDCPTGRLSRFLNLLCEALHDPMDKIKATAALSLDALCDRVIVDNRIRHALCRILSEYPSCEASEFPGEPREVAYYILSEHAEKLPPSADLCLSLLEFGSVRERMDPFWDPSMASHRLCQDRETGEIVPGGVESQPRDGTAAGKLLATWGSAPLAVPKFRTGLLELLDSPFRARREAAIAITEAWGTKPLEDAVIKADFEKAKNCRCSSSREQELLRALEDPDPQMRASALGSGNALFVLEPHLLPEACQALALNMRAEDAEVRLLAFALARHLTLFCSEGQPLEFTPFAREVGRCDHVVTALIGALSCPDEEIRAYAREALMKLAWLSTEDHQTQKCMRASLGVPRLAHKTDGAKDVVQRLAEWGVTPEDADLPPGALLPGGRPIGDDL